MWLTYTEIIIKGLKEEPECIYNDSTKNEVKGHQKIPKYLHNILGVYRYYSVKIAFLQSTGVLKMDMRIIYEMTTYLSVAAIFANFFEICLMDPVLVP